MLLIPAIIFSTSPDPNLNFSSISPEIAILLFLAVLLRLGFFSAQKVYINDRIWQNGQSVLTKFILISSSFVLITRVSVEGIKIAWPIWVTTAIYIALIFFSIGWLLLPNSVEGKSLWIKAFSTFAILSSFKGDLIASQVWSISLIFSGSFLYLYNIRTRRLIWLPILGILGFSALPFTPAWSGLSVLINSKFAFWVCFSFGLGALIIGYYRFTNRPSEYQETQVGWLWIVYPIGLLILPLTHIVVIWQLDGFRIPTEGILQIRWWLGLVVLVVSVIIYIFARRSIESSEKFQRAYLKAYSYPLMDDVISRINRIVGGFINYFLEVLEADGGLLWAVLILILLISLLVSRMIGI
jgi:hypothetical protein